MSASSSSTARTPPRGYYCTYTNQVMDDPVLSRSCGHLFNRAVMDGSIVCPLDLSPLTAAEIIPFAELKKEIEVWKQSLNPPEQKKSYRAALAAQNQWEKVKNEKLSSSKTIANAHADDIHGFLSLTPDCFVSGSKDNTLKMWTAKGELQKELNPSEVNGYKYWVTALAAFQNGSWASATRDGTLTVWDPKGEQISSLQYNPSPNTQNQYVAKDRNKKRIHCIAELPSQGKETLFYTGTPRFIQLWNADRERMLRYYEANTNDWVYCIEVLDNRAQDLLVVIAADLQLWEEMHSKSPKKTGLIIETPEEHKAYQRPHISAIKRLEHDSNQMSCALFDGSVKLIDLAAQKTSQIFREHRGRVWAVENIAPQVIASCADDKTIKLWDVRQPASLFTLKGNPGRVSSLLRISNQTFISGSCPDNVFESEEKASIRFWDIRQFHLEDR